MSEGGYDKPLLKKIDSPSHYQRIGVPRDATKKEIKSGYRKMAANIHPDTGDISQKSARQELMKHLNAAYETLSDPTKKLTYDTTLKQQEAERLRREQEEFKKKAEAEKQKLEAERRARAREEAERKRQREEQGAQERLATERKWKEEQEAIKLKEEAEKRERDRVTKTRGHDMGVRLSSWIYTNDGRTEEKKLRDLLIWAAKKKEGPLLIFESKKEREGRIDSLIMGMINSDSLRDWGYGSDLAKHIRSRWEKEGLNKEQVEKRFLKLEQHMRELAHAKQYDKEGGYNREWAIPVNLGPDSHTRRYNYSYAKIWNRNLYIVGFKEAWEKVRSSFEMNQAR